MPHRTIQTFTVAPLLLQLYVVLLADRFLLTHFYESLSWLPSHGDTYMYNMLLSVFSVCVPLTKVLVFVIVGGVSFHWSSWFVIVLYVVWLLAFFVDHNDDDQDDDFGQDAQQRPKPGQVAPDPQHRHHGRGADHVGGVTLILSRVRADVQVDDAQLSVVIFVVNEETAGGVFNVCVKPIVQFVPGPDRVGVASGLTVEQGLLALVLIVTTLVACDVRTSFNLDGGVSRRSHIKGVDTHVFPCILSSGLLQVVLGVGPLSAGLFDLLPILHPEALDVGAVG